MSPQHATVHELVSFFFPSRTCNQKASMMCCICVTKKLAIWGSPARCFLFWGGLPYCPEVAWVWMDGNGAAIEKSISDMRTHWLLFKWLGNHATISQKDVVTCVRHHVKSFVWHRIHRGGNESPSRVSEKDFKFFYLGSALMIASWTKVTLTKKAYRVCVVLFFSFTWLCFIRVTACLCASSLLCCRITFLFIKYFQMLLICRFLLVFRCTQQNLTLPVDVSH